MSSSAVHAVQTLAVLVLTCFAAVAVMAYLTETPDMRGATVTATAAPPLSRQLHSPPWTTSSANFSNA